MPRANVTQTSFLGGEWGPLSQGRSDLPAYRIAMAVCLNGLPVEEGSWTKRSGIETMGPTYLRTAAKFLRFQSQGSTPYLMEFTNDKLRLWYGTGPVCTNDRQVITASSSSGGVISLTTTSNHGWSVGDHLVIFCPAGITLANRAVVANRHLQIATQNGTTGLTAKDDLGTALPSDISSSGLNGATAIRIKRFDSTGVTTAYLQTLRAIQAQTQAVIVGGMQPQVVTVTTDQSGDTDPTITFAAATFLDGPYNDPQPDTGTVGAYTGSITFTPASSTFVAADVGRHIRLFSRPPAWASGTTYNYGDTATYPAGTQQYWVSVDKSNANTNQIPGSASLQTSGVPLVYWAPAPAEGQWAWGTITAQASTSCTVSLTTNLNSKNGSTISSWQLGTYMAGAYPTCGTYHDGRLWLAGAVPNRFDASTSNGVSTAGIIMSPTDVYGNQNDDNAISATMNFDNITTINWMVPDAQGIIMGTDSGEVLVASSTLDDALTPTNIRARMISKFQVANVEPVRSGLSLVFVQRLGRRIIEYLAPSAFSNKYAGRHLNEYAKHITTAGVKEVAYQEETAPIVWCLTNDGLLSGCTYRRVSPFATEAPVFEGWHRHLIGDGSTVNSMCTAPGVDGISDHLYLNTLDANGYYWVETMRPLFEEA